MHLRRIVGTLARAMAASLFALALAPAAAGPHEHGVVYLDLAVDGPMLSVQMRAPLEGLLGFERAPRTATERQAAAELLAHLAQPGSVLQPASAAGCEPLPSELQAGVLQGHSEAARGGHAELQAHYQWRCARPEQLSAATAQLFERYRGVRRIEVQVAGATGQSRATLRPSARIIRLR